jgi:dTDP-4-dehydrorhamnose 3,5-epimerase
MKFIEIKIPDLRIIEPKVFADSRGYFMEVFKEEKFTEQLGNVHFIQDNESCSPFGVMRGLHYQEGDAAQAKLVRVIVGCVLDVVVDIRADSATFGRYEMVELSADNKRQLFIPRGFAHGFLVMSEKAIFAYKVDAPYVPDQERTLNFLDPALNIPWPLPPSQMILSDKDRAGKFLDEIRS